MTINKNNSKGVETQDNLLNVHPVLILGGPLEKYVCIGLLYINKARHIKR